MTTTETTGQHAAETVIPTAPEATPETDPAVIAPLASYLAKHLTGIHHIGFKFVQIAATSNGNVITADLTRRRFDGDDCAAQIPITITIGPPTAIDPAPLPEEISAWSQQILNLWTDSDTGPGAAA